MKHLLTLLIFIISWTNFAQEKKSVDEDTTPFQVVEEVPVYRGCKKFKDNVDLKKCMSDKIVKLISKNFKTRIANKLDLPDGLINIFVTFKINRNGNIVGIAARAPHKALEKEAIRVISLIPNMKPGYVRGKPVTVPYSLPIRFVVENKKKSKN